MRPPRLLYKYEPFSTQSLLNLKRQVIYFGSPLMFNDPYDCALTPNIVIPSDEELEWFVGPICRSLASPTALEWSFKRTTRQRYERH